MVVVLGSDIGNAHVVDGQTSTMRYHSHCGAPFHSHERAHVLKLLTFPVGVLGYVALNVFASNENRGGRQRWVQSKPSLPK